MIQPVDRRTAHKRLIGRRSGATKRLRARVEHLLSRAYDLLESPGANKFEADQRAYQYSEEALRLLAQLREQEESGRNALQSDVSA
ncbi:MAG: hypothetical protein IAE80_12420 [Anaerolinea sp.]|nr:hypothetical protein [Anaerolinea sp.]